jgi:putative methionine-R-sulfoxide reductase with GAF domain
MYDPLVVDSFIRVRSHMVPTDIHVALPRHALAEITNSSQPSTIGSISAADERTTDERTTYTNKILTAHQLAATLTKQLTFKESCDAIAGHLGSLSPFALCVFYIYNPRTDELESGYISGDYSFMPHSIRIQRGKKLSGWVAANRRTIVNSDPILDLGDLARSATARLRSCISAPMVAEGELVGVLTLYSLFDNAFTEEQGRIAEAFANRAAAALKRSNDVGLFSASIPRVLLSTQATTRA